MSKHALLHNFIDISRQIGPLTLGLNLLGTGKLGQALTGTRLLDFQITTRTLPKQIYYI